MSINIAADFGQKFYRLWKSVPVIAELNKTPVSKMGGSHVWRLFCLTGLQNLIYASFLLKIAASNRLLQLFRPWKNKPSSMQPDSQAVGFTKSLTWHHLLLKSKISHLHLLCTHIKWSKNWESGFRAAIKTPTRWWRDCRNREDGNTETALLQGGKCPRMCVSILWIILKDMPPKESILSWVNALSFSRYRV